MESDINNLRHVMNNNAFEVFGLNFLKFEWMVCRPQQVAVE